MIMRKISAVGMINLAFAKIGRLLLQKRREKAIVRAYSEHNGTIAIIKIGYRIVTFDPFFNVIGFGKIISVLNAGSFKQKSAAVNGRERFESVIYARGYTG